MFYCLGIMNVELIILIGWWCKFGLLVKYVFWVILIDLIYRCNIFILKKFGFFLVVGGVDLVIGRVI